MNFIKDNQQLLIVGLGISGRAAARYALLKGQIVWGYDDKLEEIAQQEELCELQKKGLVLWRPSPSAGLPPQIDFLLTSPGVPLSHPLLEEASRQAIGCQSEIEYGLQQLYGSWRIPMVAITGSNGKTTTALLTSHLLRYFGLRVEVIGNIGRPPTELLIDLLEGKSAPPELLVVEMSSYQLEQMASPLFAGGLLLNASENHLERHGSMEAYVKAKLNMASCLLPQAPFFVGSQLKRDFLPLLQQVDRPIRFFDLSPLGSPLLTGAKLDSWHRELQGSSLWMRTDLENLLGAMALVALFGMDEPKALEASQSFIKPPHRMQRLEPLGDVLFYNDSKSTTLSSTIAAVEALQGQNIALIAGGLMKSDCFLPWRSTLAQHVQAIYAIGQAAPLIAEQLGDLLPVYLKPSLDEAVEAAYQTVAPKGCVLLSPGCASLDLFSNFQERGLAFEVKVEQLRSKSAPRRAL